MASRRLCIGSLGGVALLRAKSTVCVPLSPTPIGPRPLDPDGVHYSEKAWVPGALWIGDFDGKRLVKVSLETGEVVKELASDRFVTGIEWIGGALWHGGWRQNGSCADAGGEDSGASQRRVEEDTGTVLQEVGLEGRWNVSGTGVDAQGRLWCGGGGKGGIRAVQLLRG